MPEESSAGGAINEIRHVLMDYFSPLAITNGAAVTERYAFGAFGRRSILNAAGTAVIASSAVAWEFGFHGQFRDSETGLYNYGYRHYAPALGRFLSKDPIMEAGGNNLYRMAGNSAVNAVDHLGLLDGQIPFTGAGGIPLNQFLNDQLKRGALTEDDVENAKSGCIGICRAYQGTPPPDPLRDPPVMPELQPNTSCYLTEIEAEASGVSMCNGKKPFVFAKQGDWKRGRPQRDTESGRIPKDSITGKDGVRNRYDYVAKVGPAYVHVDGPVTFDQNRKPRFPPVHIDRTPPPVGDGKKYPQQMWCFTCCEPKS